MNYKLWLQIEEIDGAENHYENIGDPDWIAEYDTLQEAQAQFDLVAETPPNETKMALTHSKAMLERLMESTNLLARISEHFFDADDGPAKDAKNQIMENLKVIDAAQKEGS